MPLILCKLKSQYIPIVVQVWTSPRDSPSIQSTAHKNRESSLGLQGKIDVGQNISTIWGCYLEVSQDLETCCLPAKMISGVVNRLRTKAEYIANFVERPV
jgi:hypothetical protein